MRAPSVQIASSVLLALVIGCAALAVRDFCFAAGHVKISPAIANRPTLQALDHDAVACSAEGTRLLAEAAALTEAAAQQARSEARRQFCRAGRRHLDLARERYATRKFPDHLWAAAINLAAGEDWPGTVRVLRAYLWEESFDRRPEALCALGEALQKLGSLEASVRCFETCAKEHSSHPLASMARLEAAHGWRELGDLSAAEGWLLVNLADTSLTPASREWRHSLLALGMVHQAAERPVEATACLTEFIGRYPEEGATARYLLARVLRSRAKENSERRQSTAKLQEALQLATQTQEMLEIRSKRHALTELEKKVLRNAWFLRCDLLLALERADEAEREARRALDSWKQGVEGIEAQARIAAALRQLGEPEAARAALTQALAALTILPTEELEQEGNFTAQSWQALLDCQAGWR